MRNVSATLAVALLLLACALPATAERKVNILLLSGSEAGSRRTALILDSMRREFAAQDVPASLYLESLDELRFPLESGALAHELEVLSDRFSSLRFDIILADGGIAPLNLALRYRAKHDPDIPVFAFGVVEKETATRHAGEKNLYIRLLPDPVVSTVRLAARLFPDANRAMLIVSKAKAADAEFLSTLDELRRESPGISFALVENNESQASEALGAAGPRSFVVLLVPDWTTAGGNSVGGWSLAGALKAKYGLPVFSVFSDFLGTGIVGGSFATEELLGKEAARTVHDILSAAAGQRILDTSSALQGAVDYRALETFSIPAGRVPASVRILFAPPPFWVQNQVPLEISGVLLVIAMIALAAYSAIRRHDRKALRKSNEELERMVAERTAEYEASNRNLDESLHRIEAMQERLVGEAKENMIGRLALGLAHEINNPLAAIRASNDAVLALLADGPSDLASRVIALGDTERELFFSLLPLAFRPPRSIARLGEGERARLGEMLRSWGCADPAELAEEISGAGLADLAPEKLAALCSERGSPVLEALYFCSVFGRSALISDEASRKIAETIEAIRSFARESKASGERTEVELAASLDRALLLFPDIEQSGIALTKDYEGGLARLLTDEPLLISLWANLLENALKSMRAAGGRSELLVRARIDSGFALVEIAYSGHVIPQEKRGELFEPFADDGDLETGLGLALCKRSVRDLGGSIEYDPSAGRPLFRVRIPLAG